MTEPNDTENRPPEDPRLDHLGRPIPTEQPKSQLSRFLANVRTIATALFIALVIRYTLFENFLIEGPSMMPTLLDGDRVVVAKYPYGVTLPFMERAVFTWGAPKLGDIVILNRLFERGPTGDGSGIFGHGPDDIVKRVVGVAGDVIEVNDDIVSRNGAPIFVRNAGPCRYEYDVEQQDNCELVEERVGEVTYRTSHDAVGGYPSNHEAVRIPEGHVFVLGDHRDHSRDSRIFGIVPVDTIKGRVVATYWSSSPRVDNGSAFLSNLRFARMFKSID
jgi:signal peptidase I